MDYSLWNSCHYFSYVEAESMKNQVPQKQSSSNKNTSLKQNQQSQQRRKGDKEYLTFRNKVAHVFLTLKSQTLNANPTKAEILKIHQLNRANKERLNISKYVWKEANIFFSVPPYYSRFFSRW